MSLIEEFLARVEHRRSATGSSLDQSKRAAWGQYFTPLASAQLLASMAPPPSVEGWTLIDPGAGVGSLTAALVARWLAETDRPVMSIIAYEIDYSLLESLEETLAEARALAQSAGRRLDTTVRHDNFILNPPGVGEGNILLMNPPYRKLNVRSDERVALERGASPVRVTNLYAAFLICAVRALASGGGLVAITPRSFANGPYFRDLRADLLSRASFRRIHIFEARDRVFADADVLQESIVFSMEAGGFPADIAITASRDASDPISTVTRRHGQIIHPGDAQHFVRLPLDDTALSVAERMSEMPCTLAELGCSVSTGRVVDFRAKEHLRVAPGEGTVPLVYPQNLHAGLLKWPLLARKPQALQVTPDTANLLLPNEHYVIVKRFSAKEEARRVVAAVATPEAFGGAEAVAYENHLNVFHISNRGLPCQMATGLAAYLNSRFADEYIRQFNGHTQINATDLRELRFPTAEQLNILGAAADELSDPVDPDALDRILDSVTLQVESTSLGAVA